MATPTLPLSDIGSWGLQKFEEFLGVGGAISLNLLIKCVFHQCSILLGKCVLQLHIVGFDPVLLNQGFWIPLGLPSHRTPVLTILDATLNFTLSARDSDCSPKFLNLPRGVLPGLRVK